MSPQKSTRTLVRSEIESDLFGKAAQMGGGDRARNPSDGAYDAVRLLKVAC